jgi:membrane protein implicated in regulation of membrane protease activity
MKGMLFVEYLWLALVILSGVAEAATTQLVAIWFAPGALIAMILAFCGVHIAVQVAVFVVLTVAMLVLSKTVFRSFFTPPKRENFNIEAVVGEKCLVTERIDNIAGRGAVKLKGLEWAARTVSDELTVEEGERVEVIAVEGVKLICKKL